MLCSLPGDVKVIRIFLLYMEKYPSIVVLLGFAVVQTSAQDERASVAVTIDLARYINNYQ